MAGILNGTARYNTFTSCNIWGEKSSPEKRAPGGIKAIVVNKLNLLSWKVVVSTIRKDYWVAIMSFALRISKLIH